MPPIAAFFLGLFIGMFVLGVFMIKVQVNNDMVIELMAGYIADKGFCPGAKEPIMCPLPEKSVSWPVEVIRPQCKDCIRDYFVHQVTSPTGRTEIV